MPRVWRFRKELAGIQLQSAIVIRNIIRELRIVSSMSVGRVWWFRTCPDARTRTRSHIHCFKSFHIIVNSSLARKKIHQYYSCRCRNVGSDVISLG